MARFLLALVAVLALAGCGSDGSPTPEASPPTAGESPVSGTTLAGPGLDGEPISLADFRGKPVFVNVWSSW